MQFYFEPIASIVLVQRWWRRHHYRCDFCDTIITCKRPNYSCKSCEEKLYNSFALFENEFNNRQYQEEHENGSTY